VKYLTNYVNLLGFGKKKNIIGILDVLGEILNFNNVVNIQFIE
jgi:hypothetical protein